MFRCIPSVGRSFLGDWDRFGCWLLVNTYRLHVLCRVTVTHMSPVWHYHSLWPVSQPKEPYEPINDVSPHVTHITCFTHLEPARQSRRGSTVQTSKLQSIGTILTGLPVARHPATHLRTSSALGPGGRPASLNMNGEFTNINRDYDWTMSSLGGRQMAIGHTSLRWQQVLRWFGRKLIIQESTGQMMTLPKQTSVLGFLDSTWGCLDQLVSQWLVEIGLFVCLLGGWPSTVELRQPRPKPKPELA